MAVHARTILGYRNPYLWLVLGCVAAYASSLLNGFAWLDESEILRAEYRVESAQDFSAVFTQPLDEYSFRNEGKTTTQGGYWRPLYALSISLDWFFWGENATWFHLENLVWHILVVLSLYIAGRELVFNATDSKRERALAKASVFWASMLFGVCPLGVHSVSWISGRKDTLCALFAIVALIALIRFARHGRRWWFAVSLCSLMVALGCKELAVVLPVVATCYLIVQWATLNREERWRWGLGLVGTWLTVGGYFQLRTFVLGGIGLDMDAGANPWYLKFGNAVRLLMHYGLTVVWPHPIVLSDRWDLALRWRPVETLQTTLVAAIAVALAIWRGKAKSIVLIGVVWFAIWLLPAFGFLPLRHLRAERYLYPASWGLMLAVCGLTIWAVQGFAKQQSKTGHRWWKLEGLQALHAPREIGRVPLHGVLLGGYVLVLVVLTNLENRYWKNDETLFSRALQIDPGYLEGRVGLAHHFIKNSEFQAAIDTLDELLTMVEREEVGKSGYWSPYVVYMNRAAALRQLNRIEEANANFLEAVRYQPGLSAPRFGAGLCAMDLHEYQEAEQHFSKVVLAEPDSIAAVGNLALSKLYQNMPAEAESLLNPWRDSPHMDAVTLRTYGSALLLQQKFSAAIPVFERIIELDPEEASDWAKLAWAHWGALHGSEAETAITRARRIDSADATVQYVSGLIPQE